MPASGKRVSWRAGWIGYLAAAAIIAGLVLAGFVALRGRHAEVSGRREATGAGGRAGADDKTEPGGHAEETRHRIVVLPFENLGAPGDAYFAAGVTEEITSRLASASGLGVISRTSAVQYAKTGKTTRQIGAELGVDYVLAGTVRWQRGAGETSRVRVTPQLVRVSDDTQLWGDRYDREMKDIFTVQSEIAEQVVDKLGLAMQQTEGEAAGAQPTQNLEAYQLYLRGKAQVRSPTLSRDIVKQGVDLLEQAIRLDPRFAQGWAALSYAHSDVYHHRYDFTEERLAKARECADKSLALQPDLREGHLALGYYYYWGRGDYGQAREEFRLAAGKNENDPDALQAMAYVSRRQGRWDESLAAMERVLSLNPRDLDLIINMSGTYQMMRRYPEALRLIDSALSLAPDAAGPLLSKTFLQVDMDGNTRGARETLKRINRRDFPEAPAVEALLDTLDGRFGEALRRLAEFPGDVLDAPDVYRPKALLAGYIYLSLNDRPRAHASCESARQLLEREIARSPRDTRMRAALGLTLACLGRKEEAVREARLAADIMPVSSDAIDGPKYLASLALVYATLGDRDAACDLLEKLLAMPSETSVSLLRLDPNWAPLRGFPRFQNLVAQRD
jgi:TolB-like protein/Flp pilus assembly protein TadD